MKERLNEINNELKDYMNESTFISNKCRNKVIKMLGEEFDINLPTDNYQTVDISLTDKGSIIMRGDLYEGKELTEEEIEEKYNNFKEKADSFLKKKDISFKNKKLSSNIINLLIILLIFIVFIILVILGIKSLIHGDLINLLWLIIFVGAWFIPSVSENLKGRLQTAKLFIKNLLKK